MQIRHPKAALLLLAVVHVLAGPILLYFDGLFPLLPIAYVGHILAQASLLGIWVGLGPNHWATRLIGGALGTAYLAWKLERDVELSWSVVLSTFTIAAVLLVVRHWVAQVRHVDWTEASAKKRGMQFTIRDLLLVMPVTVCLLTIGRWWQPYPPHWYELAYVAIISLCCVTVVLWSVWSMLGNSHPLVRNSLLVVRHWVAQVQHVDRTEASAKKQMMQFTIRDLLLLVLIIACLLAIGRWWQPSPSEWYWLARRAILWLWYKLAQVAIISLCCVTVVLWSVWSMLGNSRPFVRNSLVLSIALGIGALVAFFPGLHQTWLIGWSLAMSSGLFVLGSLWVVRLCGFRLVRHSRG